MGRKVLKRVIIYMQDTIEIIEYKDINNRFSNELIHDFINQSMHKFIGRPLKLREDCYYIEDHYLQNGGNFWIAVDKDKIIGTIGLENRGKVGILKRLYIDENYQNLGIGSMLYKSLENYAIKKTNVKTLYLTCGKVLENAHKFYTKHGFKQIYKLEIELQVKEHEDLFKKDII